MREIPTATAFGNTLNTLRRVLRRAFPLHVHDGDVASMRRVFPRALTYWRKRVGRVSRPLTVVRPGSHTTMATRHQWTVNVFNAPANSLPAHMLFVDQRGPFHYRAIVQNLLSTTAHGGLFRLPPSSMPPQRHASGIASASASPGTALLTTTMRWRRLSAMVDVSDTTSVPRQKHVAAPLISAIPGAMRAGRRADRSSRFPIGGVQEAMARLVAPPLISRTKIVRIVSRTTQYDKGVRPGSAEPFRFPIRHAARTSSIPHNDLHDPKVMTPASLTWRCPEVAREAAPPRPAPEADQHSVVRERLGAAQSVAFPGAQVAAEGLPARTPEAIIKEFLSGPTLDRLADDVLRRVDKRMRIERERRGL